MLNVKTLFCYASMMTLLIACAGQPTKNEDENMANRGALFLCSIKEPGTAEYRSTIFVNADVMFTRDSRAPKDFLVFDRKTKIVYSTNAEDKTIFVIKPKAVAIQSPIAIEYTEESQPSSAIPKVQDMQATHYSYAVNGEHCYDTVALPATFLPQVVQAMVDFRTTMAGEHASTLANTPKEMLDACDLAINIFNATKHYEHGLPIREWDRKGYQRFLMDYKTGVPMDPKEYELPEGYEHYSITDK